MQTQFDETLERIRKATGVRTQVELAAILGIRQSSISDAKRRNSVPAEWYLKLFRTYGLNPDWLADGSEPMYIKPGLAEQVKTPEAVREVVASYGKVPSRCRVTGVSSMAGSLTEDGAWAPEIVGQLAVPETYYKPSIVVVHVDGSSMEPLIRRGAYVGVDTERTRILSGEIYGVHMPHEGLVIRRLFYDAEADRLVLKSENPSHPEQVVPGERKTEAIVGRLVWVLQEI